MLSSQCRCPDPPRRQRTPGWYQGTGRRWPRLHLYGLDVVVEAGVEAVSVQREAVRLQGAVPVFHQEILFSAPRVLIGGRLPRFDDEFGVADHRHDDEGHSGDGDDDVAAVVLDELLGLAGQLLDVRAIGILCSH